MRSWTTDREASCANLTIKDRKLYIPVVSIISHDYHKSVKIISEILQISLQRNVTGTVTVFLESKF